MQFPSESRYRTGFNNFFFIQHIPVIYNPITKILLKEYFPTANLTLPFATFNESPLKFDWDFVKKMSLFYLKYLNYISSQSCRFQSS